MLPMFVQAKLKGQSMENKNVRIATNAYDILSVENSLEHRILNEQSVLKDFENNATQYIVCYVQNDIAGYLAYSNCIDHIDIVSIAVKPEFRKKGVAQELFNYLIQLNTEGLSLFLEVRASNLPAINLYKKLNFEHISTRKNYYSNPVEDALIYIKK